MQYGVAVPSFAGMSVLDIEKYLSVVQSTKVIFWCRKEQVAADSDISAHRREGVQNANLSFG